MGVSLLQQLKQAGHLHTHSQTNRKMARFLILTLALIGLVASDGTGHHHHAEHKTVAEPVPDAYNAPQAYAAPEAPTYSAPQAPTYAAPEAAYDAPAPAPAYNAPAQDAYGSPAAPSYDAYGSPAAPAYDAYGSPQAAPVYTAPAENYATPAQGYAAPENAPTYAADAVSAPEIDLSKLLGVFSSEYFPVFLAFFVGIIVANIFLPLIAPLLALIPGFGVDQPLLAALLGLIPANQIVFST